MKSIIEHRARVAADRIARDDELRAASTTLQLSVELRAGLSVTRIDIVQGTVGVVSAACEAQVVLSAPERLWEAILARVPPPGCQSLTALQRCRPEFEIRSNPLLFAQALHALERLLEVLREEGDDDAVGAPTKVLRDIGLIEGHYRDIDGPGGVASTIYYEKSGIGAPIVMLHTAGADSRQYHNLLTDCEIAADWTMHAFDLPSHGRSFPVRGCEGKPWKLSESDYAGWCVSFIRTVVGRPAVVLGCSMGAAISIVLAARHAQWIEAIVALEAPDRSPGRRNPYLRHAEVNQGEYVPAYVGGLMSPRSPLRLRRIARWIYAQGGPGVYWADLGFYSDEYDGVSVAPLIDAQRTPVYLLTGEYDYSASPASTQRLANAIPGAVFRTMPGLGHFPMAENPDELRKHLAPILQILKTTAADRLRLSGSGAHA